MLIKKSLLMNKTETETKGNRIEILDSYRFIAILSVMLYHYYSRWTTPINNVTLYPYGSAFNHFSYGWLGVEFFFIISGFVIALTLTKTNDFFEFWKKRLIRLLPSMFICSAVTFVVFNLIDTKMLFPASHSFKNFLYSITLLSPEVLNKLFLLKIHGNYINWSYWSLWPEIQFYFIASCVYFSNRKNFVFNFAVFSIILCIVDYILLTFIMNVHAVNLLNLKVNESVVQKYFRLKDTFNYVGFSLYFVMGVLFFQIYSKEKKLMSAILMLLSILLLLFMNDGFNIHQLLPIHSIFIMVLLFVGFTYYSKQLNFISIKPIMNIGVASYTLYLIHEVIGVLLINKYASIFGKYDFLFPILVILLMIGFALLSFKYIEKPIGTYLKKKLI